MTGIFWLTLNCNSVFFATTETLEESEKYGKWLISKYNHYSKWEEIKAKGLLNALPLHIQEEYFYLPRGRVSYDTETQKFCIFHGNWLKDQQRTLLCKHYQLGINNVVFVEDEHYTV